MKMHGLIKRYLGAAPAGGKLLGTDSLPATQGQRASGDNVISLPTRSQSGFPLKNLYVGAVYLAGGGSPTTIGALNIYAFDEASQMYLLVNNTATVTVGTLAAPVAPTVVTPITLIDPPATFSNAQAGNSGTMQLLVVMGPGTAQPNGTYGIYVGGGM